MDLNNAMHILGLKLGFTEVELKKTYRRLSKKYHPDNVSTGNEDKFKEIQYAFDYINNNYDFESNQKEDNKDFYPRKQFILQGLIKMYHEYNNPPFIKVIQKYMDLIANSKNKNDLEKYFQEFKQKYNEEPIILLEKDLDLAINSIRKYAVFNLIKDSILKEKERIIDYFSKNDSTAESLVNQFKENILEFTLIIKSRKARIDYLKTKYKELNLNEQFNDLEKNLKQANFQKKLELLIKYIKNLKAHENAININTIYQSLLITVSNKKSNLNIATDLDEIKRIDTLFTRIYGILKMGILGIISFEDLEILFNFDFSSKSENILNHLEDIINTPKSTNIFIDKNNLFFYLNYSQDGIILSCAENEFEDGNYSINDIANLESLDSFFDKIDLIGNLALKNNHLCVIIAKLKENRYMVYDIEEVAYMIVSEIKYMENKKLEDNLANEILKEINNDDINAIKQRFIDPAIDIKDEFKDKINNYFKYKQF